MSETGADDDVRGATTTAAGQAADGSVSADAVRADGTTTEPSAGARPTWAGRSRRFSAKPRRSTAVLALIALVSGLAFATIFAVVVTRLHGGTDHPLLRPTNIPKDVSTRLAVMMQLSPVPVTTAPDFTLTDQSGHQVSLASMQGHPVVLTFMDSHCTDICPLVSREFINAYKDLGAAGRNVVFIAVNVNPYHHSTADVAHFSSAEGLTSIPTWHFVTGSVPSLHKVWNKYQIQIQATKPSADVVHTSVIYFIDAHGKERYVAAPMADHTKGGTAFLPAGQLAAWGKGIALVIRATSH